jgi:uncharacterized protein YdhG (YjbR/CyaY superfamily)
MTHERGSASAGPLSAYLDSLDEPTRGVLRAIATQAHDLLETEEGVSYNMPALLYRGKALVAVRETAKHLALYPYSGRTVSAVAPELDRLGFGFSSGAIRFSVDHRLPPELVQHILLTRRDEIDQALAR